MPDTNRNLNPIEQKWVERDGRMTMVWAERARPRRLSLERILAVRAPADEPAEATRRRIAVRASAVLLLLAAFLACVAGLMR